MVSRELRRNRGLRGLYRPKQAQEMVLIRWLEKTQSRIPFSTWVLMDDRIKRDWSPEQIEAPLFMEQG